MKYLNKFTTGESSHAQVLDDNIDSDNEECDVSENEECDVSENEAEEPSDEVSDVDVETETETTDTETNEDTSVPPQR